MTQTQQVMNYMEQFGSITQAEAWRVLNISRLGARIHELKKNGVPIDTTMKHYSTKDGKHKHYASYSIGKTVI